MEYTIRTVTPEDLGRRLPGRKPLLPCGGGGGHQRSLSDKNRPVSRALFGGRVGGRGNCGADQRLLHRYAGAGDELYEPDCPHSLKNPWQTVFGLAVDPEYQHRGIAKNLMNALVTRARDGGQKGVILTCKKEKIGFYEAMGYVCQGESASEHGGAVWYDMRLTF